MENNDLKRKNRDSISAVLSFIAYMVVNSWIFNSSNILLIVILGLISAYCMYEVVKCNSTYVIGSWSKNSRIAIIISCFISSILVLIVYYFVRNKMISNA